MCPSHFLSSLGHKHFESESSKVFSSRFRVESWLAHVESQKLSSHLESLVCKFTIFPMSQFAVKRPSCCKWLPVSLKMVLHVVRASFIGCYVYCVACTSFFKAVWILVLFHSHSFLQLYPNIAASVATFCLALPWMCDSPRVGCARRTIPI